MDIIFAEPDRLSPGKLVEPMPDIPAPLARELAMLPTNEAALAEAFKEVPTVLAESAPRMKLRARQRADRRASP